MKISVIIPTYRPQFWLFECLDSIKKQTLNKDEFEIILVLNGCCEPYFSEINEYLHINFNGFNFNFLHTSIGGVSNARNIGLDNCKGEYITFIDDDDYVSETYLYEMLTLAEPYNVVLTNTKAFLEKTRNENIKYSLSNIYQSLYNKKLTINNTRIFFGGPVRKLIDRNIIDNNRFNCNYQNGEDSLFMFLISKNICKIKFTPSNAIYYRRIREGSATTSKKKFKYKLNNRLSLIKDYTIIYIKNIKEYNFIFYCTRILACIKDILIN